MNIGNKSDLSTELTGLAYESPALNPDAKVFRHVRARESCRVCRDNRRR